jgi:uncharacterized membrane protein YecN with MAPEG domain
MIAPITGVYAALAGLMSLALAALVVRARRRYKTSIGTGKEPAVEMAVRVHANFVEYVPLALLLMLLGEVNGVSGPALHGAGILLLVSRILHAFGLGHSPGRSFGRFYGTAGTWVVMLFLSVALLARVLG